MSTKLKIKQLEKKYKLIARQQGKTMVYHDITNDGRLLDKEDFIMTKEEVKQIAKEDAEVHKNDGILVFMLSYSEPKMKPNSATEPYHINSYKSEAWRKTDTV